ncbi:hypothetical protein MTR67_002851 [Solanum verrucosum]|uniref:DUF4283 domain-containing protein n=1 Tax=Solanum verrucosum TaxID=315347 RepID=A0AAF0PRM3_SOLVR|nr:hypothetical protein MTR67_002851 [Solanum verrucosum]
MLKKSGGGINDVDVASMFTKEGRKICINDDSFLQNEVLKRSLVGKFENKVNVPLTLAEMRRWSSNTWKQSHGLNIYEMGSEMFLFEFASRNVAEQVTGAGKISPLDYSGGTR